MFGMLSSSALSFSFAALSHHHQIHEQLLLVSHRLTSFWLWLLRHKVLWLKGTPATSTVDVRNRCSNHAGAPVRGHFTERFNSIIRHPFLQLPTAQLTQQMIRVRIPKGQS